MKTKKATNKDGSTRKSGSGRKKGSNSFARVLFCDLKDYIGEKTPIVVSRVWLESLGIHSSEEDCSIKLPLTEEKESSKIQFKVKTFKEEETE
jgi:hypothetical protein